MNAGVLAMFVGLVAAADGGAAGDDGAADAAQRLARERIRANAESLCRRYAGEARAACHAALERAAAEGTAARPLDDL